MNKIISLRTLTIAPIVFGMSTLASSAAITAVENINILIPSTFEGVYIDLLNPPTSLNLGSSGAADNSNGSSTISFSEPAGDWDFNFFFGGIGIAHNSSVNPYRDDPTDNLSVIEALGVGATIDGTTATALGALPLTTPGFGGSGTGSSGSGGVSSSQSHIGTDPGQFEPGVESYIGFVLDPGTASETYGWISVTFQNNGTPGIINSFAFSDDPLAVGAIPEPSSALLVILSSGLLLRRRR